MRYTVWIALGALWGVVGVALLGVIGTTPDRVMSAVIRATPSSAALGILFQDNLIAPLRLLLLPYGVGLDLLTWTVGVPAWLVAGRGWPGAALGNLLAPHPVLAWVLVLLGAALAGAGLLLAAVVLVRLAFGAHHA